MPPRVGVREGFRSKRYTITGLPPPLPITCPAVRRESRLHFFLLVLAVIVAVNLARQGYGWVAYADERSDLRRLTIQLDSSALQVVGTSVEAARLRSVIEEADAWLSNQRAELDRVERRAAGGGVPPALYDGYLRTLERYNGRVNERNERYERWREVVAANHRAVDRYNAVADSMRAVGARMREPYIDVPSPAEVAARHGWGEGGGEEVGSRR